VLRQANNQQKKVIRIWLLLLIARESQLMHKYNKGLELKKMKLKKKIELKEKRKSKLRKEQCQHNTRNN
jgi:hypothetical protein